LSPLSPFSATIGGALHRSHLPLVKVVARTHSRALSLGSHEAGGSDPSYGGNFYIF
jgi:hypothetical protein